MEILLQTNPDLNIATAKPMSRKLAVDIAQMSDSLHKFFPYDYYYRLSRIDQYNLNDLLMNNIEWVRGNTDSFLSKRPFLHTFYTHKANFFEVNEKDFFLAVDPVIQQTQSYETGNSERVFLNSKGLTLRGMIAGKLGVPVAELAPEKRAAGDMTHSVAVINACKPYHWRNKFPPSNAPSAEIARKARERFGWLLDGASET